MARSTGIIVALIAICTFIQPTPAPPLLIAGVGVALGAAASTAGAAASNLKRDQTPGGPSGPGAPAGAGGNASFEQCLADSATMKSTPVMHFTGLNGVTVSSMPQSCYDAINEYNAYGDSATLGSVYGNIAVQGTNIVMTGVPNYAMQNAWSFWGSASSGAVVSAGNPATPPPTYSHWSNRV